MQCCQFQFGLKDLNGFYRPKKQVQDPILDEKLLSVFGAFVPKSETTVMILIIANSYFPNFMLRSYR